MDTKNYTSQTPYHFDEGDDGSLSALGIDTDRDRKTFNCKAIRQTDLIDKSFWVLDYFGDIMGKDGKMKYIFKAKYNLEDDESEAFKVWTGSTEKQKHDALGSYKGWLKYCDSKNLVKTINRKGNGKIIK